MKKTKKEKIIDDGARPYMISEASSTGTTSVRRNLAGTIERTDRFKNIDDGLVPFRHSSLSYGKGNSSVDIRDAVILCQKCYYNFPLFRNIIDLMTEFSVNDIFYRGGNSKSKKFFEAWGNKINLWDLQDRFFREYFRSGNVFIYRFDSEITPDDINKITSIYGSDEMEVQKLQLPSRYIILNPADIQMMGTSNFGWGVYFKLLTDYEVNQLKNPKTDEDVAVLNALPESARKQIKAGNTAVIVPLDITKISIVFYKKQDYEPFSVPMGYPVLEDINAKAEMKKIDMAVARTMQQIILLVTTGTEPDKGGINPKNIEALRKMFESQSVWKVLVADYTTQAEFKVPSVAELLNPQKYEILDRDINIGLNNIFAGEEKFANQQQKVELFVARLEQARNAFLNNFLIPEIKRISKSLGFKNYPTPYFEDVELKDNTNNAKIYARLMELGILTPEQGLQAIESNTLPDMATMIEDQRAYKDLRDEGLYEPLVGGAKEDAGRPDGTSAPKKVTPIGAGASQKFSLAKVKDNLIHAQELEAKVISYLREKNDIKRLSKLQKEVAQEITHLIIANEEPDNWEKKVSDYCESPIDKNEKRVKEVISIAATHNLDNYLASILLASKKDEQAV
jgi:hypothetical protein